MYINVYIHIHNRLKDKTKSETKFLINTVWQRVNFLNMQRDLKLFKVRGKKGKQHHPIIDE